MSIGREDWIEPESLRVGEKGWRAVCKCGWRTAPYVSAREAADAFLRHVREWHEEDQWHEEDPVSPGDPRAI